MVYQFYLHLECTRCLLLYYKLSITQHVTNHKHLFKTTIPTLWLQIVYIPTTYIIFTFTQDSPEDSALYSISSESRMLSSKSDLGEDEAYLWWFFKYKTCCAVFFFFFFKILFIYFGREGKEERETSVSFLSHTSNQGPGPQPKHVP